jgi:hypothetical protein
MTSAYRAIGLLARRSLQQNTKAVEDALALRARLGRHHLHHRRGDADVLARPREVGRAILIMQDLAAGRYGPSSHHGGVE